MSDKCPWPMADRATIGIAEDGKLRLQLFRSEDDDGEGFTYPLAEIKLSTEFAFDLCNNILRLACR